MINKNDFTAWFKSPVNIIAGVLVIGGFLLTSVDWIFLGLTALGTFGPGILRELGLLNDKDEFEMRAARRAGYQAYLAGGLMVFLMVASFRSTERTIEYPSELMAGVLVVMWFTWLFSSLMSYWGEARTVNRILIIFGIVWLVFNVLSGEGNWKISAMQSLLALPFFGLAVSAKRWTRISGILLIAASVFFFWFLGLYQIFQNPFEMGRIVLVVLFLGPLFVCGITLIRLNSESLEG
ncbi:MAG: hypothetical protein GY780_06785 [bacterium]|nr:hypothetical protein [bacterium]